jgi:hypothetical protein
VGCIRGVGSVATQSVSVHLSTRGQTGSVASCQKAASDKLQILTVAPSQRIEILPPFRS